MLTTERLDNFHAYVKVGDLGRVRVSDVAGFEHVEEPGISVRRR